MVVFTLRESDVKKSAIDVVFDFIGADANELTRTASFLRGKSTICARCSQSCFPTTRRDTFINGKCQCSRQWTETGSGFEHGNCICGG